MEHHYLQQNTQVYFELFNKKRNFQKLFLDDDEWNEPNWISRCIVQYEYKGERADELFLKSGDIIKVIERRPDGWWRGELNGKIGLFPSTYVKELE